MHTHTHTHTESGKYAPAAAVDWRWLRYFAFLQALILGIAATSKLWLVATDEFADIKSGMQSTVLCLVAFVEFGVAGALIRARHPGTMWLLLLPLFSTFIVVSAVRYFSGNAGCGCLGSLELPRWILPLNNIIVVTLMSGLVLVRSSRIQLGLMTRLKDLIARISDPFNLGAVVSALFVAAVLLLWPLLSETQVWSSFVSGQQFPPERYETGELAVKRRQDLTVKWKNTSDLPVKFIGSQVSCTCLGIAGELPVVAPRSEARLTINVRPRNPGHFHQRVVCFVDHPDQGRVILDILGTAVLPPGETINER